MLDESICHLRGVGSSLSLLFLRLMENHVSKQCRHADPDPNVASDLGMQCLLITLLPVSM